MIRSAFTDIAALLVLLLVPAASAQDMDQALLKFQIGDHVGALQELMPFAEQGDAEAQNLIGAIYTSGRGVVRDHAAAATWIQRAAEQEHTLAQYNLGRMYERGQGVVQDFAEAVRWYSRAAYTGQREAQYGLGVMYYNGDGVPQDSLLAHVWVNVASANGHGTAAGVRYTISEELSESDLVTAEEIALRCRQQGYEYCVR